jgi:hypothetical protein
MTEKPTARSASYLSPPDFHRLNWACRPIRDAFGSPPYLVGSALTRPDFRDIDIRLILDDEVVASMFGPNPVDEIAKDGVIMPREIWEATRHLRFQGDRAQIRLLLNIALSDLIAKAANPPAPIDFQIQSMTEANVAEHGIRNPLGIDRGVAPIMLCTEMPA